MSRSATLLAERLSLTYNFCMPILDQSSVEFISRGPEQTRRIGARLGGLLRPGDLVGLEGLLGSGKTTFVQGIAQGWGSLDPVTSPTFVLVNVYRQVQGGHLYHLDAYRLENAGEGEELDLDQMLEDGPLVVEWPERILSALPVEGLWVDLSWIADETRGMIFHARGTRSETLLEDFRQEVFGT